MTTELTEAERAHAWRRRVHHRLCAADDGFCGDCGHTACHHRITTPRGTVVGLVMCDAWIWEGEGCGCYEFAPEPTEPPVTVEVEAPETIFDKMDREGFEFFPRYPRMFNREDTG